MLTRITLAFLINSIVTYTQATVPEKYLCEKIEAKDVDDYEYFTMFGTPSYSPGSSYLIVPMILGTENEMTIDVYQLNFHNKLIRLPCPGRSGAPALAWVDQRTVITTCNSVIEFTSIEWGMVTTPFVDSRCYDFKNMKYSPDGKFFAALCMKQNHQHFVSVWNVDTFELHDPTMLIYGNSFDFSPDGLYLTVGGNWLESYELKTFTLVHTQSYNKIIEHIVYSPDGDDIIMVVIDDSWNNRYTYYVVDPVSYRAVYLLSFLDDALYCSNVQGPAVPVFSHDDELAVQCGENIFLWSTDNLYGRGTEVVPSNTYSSVGSLAFSDNGSRIAFIARVYPEDTKISIMSDSCSTVHTTLTVPVPDPPVEPTDGVLRIETILMYTFGGLFVLALMFIAVIYRSRRVASYKVIN